MGIKKGTPVEVWWTCPKCGKKHKWEWEEFDCVSGEVSMHCDKKRYKEITRFYMAIDIFGRFVPVRIVVS